MENTCLRSGEKENPLLKSKICQTAIWLWMIQKSAQAAESRCGCLGCYIKGFHAKLQALCSTDRYMSVHQTEAPQMTLAKIIRNGNSQAIRIPHEMWTTDKEFFTLPKWAMRILPGPLMIRGCQPGRPSVPFRMISWRKGSSLSGRLLCPDYKQLKCRQLKAGRAAFPARPVVISVIQPQLASFIVSTNTTSSPGFRLNRSYTST